MAMRSNILTRGHMFRNAAAYFEHATDHSKQATAYMKHTSARLNSKLLSKCPNGPQYNWKCNSLNSSLKMLFHKNIYLTKKG